MRPCVQRGCMRAPPLPALSRDQPPSAQTCLLRSNIPRGTRFRERAARSTRFRGASRVIITYPKVELHFWASGKLEDAARAIETHRRLDAGSYAGARSQWLRDLIVAGHGRPGNRATVAAANREGLRDSILGELRDMKGTPARTRPVPMRERGSASHDDAELTPNPSLAGVQE